MDTPWFVKAKAALKARNVKYLDVAAVLDVTESAVGHYLNGRREPSVEQVKTIAKMAGLSLSEMVGDDPRFVTDPREKQLIDIYRRLPLEKQSNLLSLIESLGGE